MQATATLYHAHRATGQTATVAMALVRCGAPANAPLHGYRMALVQAGTQHYPRLRSLLGAGTLAHTLGFTTPARTSWACAYRKARVADAASRTLY